jgi:hypothetical protein
VPDRAIFTSAAIAIVEKLIESAVIAPSKRFMIIFSSVTEADPVFKPAFLEIFRGPVS